MKAAERIAWITCLVWVLAGFSNAQMMVLKGDSGATTGDLLDGTGSTGITTNVVEVSGLVITVRSGGTNQEINVTTTSLGINTDGVDDDTDAFDDAESLIFSFNRSIRISQFDFRGFESNETFVVALEGMADLEIAYDDLDNKSTDIFNTNLVISANAELELYVTGGSVIGLDGINLTVLENGPAISLIHTNGWAVVEVAFSETPLGNYILQQIGDLTDSNGWLSVSAPFSSATNWMMETTNTTAFYRVVPE